jgi:hypothetical protein
MSVVEPSGSTQGLIDRARNILFQPGAEWDRIKSEQTPLPALLTGYVLPLAALSAVCGIIGMSIFGVGFGFGPFGVTVHVPIVTAIVEGVLRVIMTMVGVWLLGLLINALAPNFGSTPDQAQAFKLSAYSATAGLLAGVFMLFPPLAPLGILGLYSLALLYIGLPRLMGTPEDKRVGYFITIVIIWIVGAIVIGWVVAMARFAMPGMGMPGFGMHAPAASSSDNVRVTLPGGNVTIDTQKAEEAAKQMEQAFGGAAAGGGAAQVKPIDLTRLSALLPDALPGGFAKTESSSGSGGMAGMNVGNVEAVYTRGDSRITLTITDMGAAGAFAGMAAAMNIQQSRETASGYEHTQTVDGRVVTEEVDREAHTAHYQVVTTNRVAVSAEGANVAVEDVRAAVNAVMGPAEAIGRAG